MENAPRQGDSINIQKFNDDLNIVTGKNGSGKTTALKAIWYILSGNISQAITEIPFSQIELETTEYKIQILRVRGHTVNIKLQIGDKITLLEDDDYEDEPDFENHSYAEDKANQHLRGISSSIFFPTFRRIEGGYSLEQESPFGKKEIEDGFAKLSRRMSKEKHLFVSSISTKDIEEMLVRRYAEINSAFSRLERESSRSIINEIKDYKLGENQDSESVINNIKETVEKLDSIRASMMAPIDAIQTTINKIFQNNGVKIGTVISPVDAAKAVKSDLLSAGEKQMLSFICYNALVKNSIIIIDEPELSLHVDWQRELFRILKNQKTNNQFVIATHSPFIYSKYPNKEVNINPDRGGEQ